MATQRFYDGQPGPDIRRELNNFETKVDGIVAAAQAASTAATSDSVKAQQWADAAPGVEVETGKYSAKHWADRAQTTVTGGLIYRGSHSAASGAYPATPSLGDYYKISVAGTLGGVEYSVGDSIIYNGTDWDKIDSMDAVTSVAGRVGAVVLTKGDVDLADVDNTSDANKPISTATQTVLDTKVDKVAGKQLSTEDYTTAEKSKLSGIASGANNYSHPEGDGNQHVPATGTTNNGKVLKAGSAAGSAAWENVDYSEVTGLQAALDGKANTTHTHAVADVTGLQAALDGKETTIAAGTATQYWRGDKSWRDFFTDVRAATLTGLSTATNAVVAATDTVLAAIGKLQAQVSAKFDKTGGDIDGNINFTGAGRRITGDFSNATVGNRTLFQTRVVNDATDLTIVPNGTSTYATVSARSSASANASVAALAVDGATVTLSSYKTGSGAYLPLTFNAGNAERLRIDPTTGNVLATSGALGYGVGAGGTVTQSTSKSTTVTLNKPSGRITMHNAALGAGQRVTFLMYNSVLEAGDTMLMGLYGGTDSPDEYHILARVVPGTAAISVRNQSGAALSDGIVINFVVIKGSAS